MTNQNQLQQLHTTEEDEKYQRILNRYTITKCQQ